MKREKYADLASWVVCAALPLCYWQPWAVVIAAAALAATVAFAHIEVRGEVKEARIAALEDSLEKLKGTAAALLKVEARTSAVERSLAMALREPAE